MATYTTITDPQVAAGASLNTALMTALRENPIAIAEGAPGAPKVIGTDFRFIATADAANDATLDFTGFNAALYDSYMFCLQNVIPATDTVDLYVRLSTDGGATFDSGAGSYEYATQALTSGGININDNSASETFIQIQGSAGVGGNINEDGISGILTVNGAGLAKRTTVTFNGGYQSGTGGLANISSSGQRRSSIETDAIRFLFSSGNVESGTITMYGMLNA